MTSVKKTAGWEVKEGHREQKGSNDVVLWERRALVGSSRPKRREPPEAGRKSQMMKGGKCFPDEIRRGLDKKSLKKQEGPEIVQYKKRNPGALFFVRASRGVKL